MCALGTRSCRGAVCHQWKRKNSALNEQWPNSCLILAEEILDRGQPQGRAKRDLGAGRGPKFLLLKFFSRIGPSPPPIKTHFKARCVQNTKTRIINLDGQAETDQFPQAKFGNEIGFQGLSGLCFPELGQTSQAQFALPLPLSLRID